MSESYKKFDKSNKVYATIFWVEKIQNVIHDQASAVRNGPTCPILVHSIKNIPKYFYSKQKVEISKRSFIFLHWNENLWKKFSFYHEIEIFVIFTVSQKLWPTLEKDLQFLIFLHTSMLEFHTRWNSSILYIKIWSFICSHKAEIIDDFKEKLFMLYQNKKL